MTKWKYRTIRLSTQGDNINNDILSELHLLRDEINLIKVKQNSMINNSSIPLPTIPPRVNMVTACVTNLVPGDPVFSKCNSICKPTANKNIYFEENGKNGIC